MQPPEDVITPNSRLGDLLIALQLRRMFGVVDTVDLPGYLSAHGIAADGEFPAGTESQLLFEAGFRRLVVSRFSVRRALHPTRGYRYYIRANRYQDNPATRQWYDKWCQWIRSYEPLLARFQGQNKTLRRKPSIRRLRWLLDKGWVVSSIVVEHDDSGEGIVGLLYRRVGRVYHFYVPVSSKPDVSCIAQVSESDLAEWLGRVSLVAWRLQA